MLEDDAELVAGPLELDETLEAEVVLAEDEEVVLGAPLEADELVKDPGLLLVEDNEELVTGALELDGELEGELDETLKEVETPFVEDEELVLGATLEDDKLEEDPCLLLEKDDGEVVTAVLELDEAEPELLVEAVVSAVLELDEAELELLVETCEELELEAV